MSIGYLTLPNSLPSDPVDPAPDAPPVPPGNAVHTILAAKHRQPAATGSRLS